jgi:stage II sporulation protein D
MREPGRKSQLHSSIAVSALLLAALFLLPLLVVVPFRSALFGREEPVDET